MKSLLIAKNNIKNRKGVSITITILVLLATVLLYLGFGFITKVSSIYDDKIKATNGSNLNVTFSDKYDTEKVVNTLKQDELITDIQVIDGIRVDNVEINSKEKDESISASFLVINESSKINISKLDIIGEKGKNKENSIIVPYIFKITYGFEVGDKFKFNVGDEEYSYNIYGFFEDTIFGNPAYSRYIKIYFFNEDYKSFDNKFGNKNHIKLVDSKCDMKNSEKINNNFTKNISLVMGEDFDCFSLDAGIMKDAFIIFPIIIMGIILGFSLIIILIIILVMNFSIKNYINDNIKNLGVLKALGYKDSSIRKAIILQFLFLSAVGIILGIIIGIALMPVTANIISSSVGLVWSVDVDIISIIVTITILLLSTFIMANLSISRIKKINPINAFRSGIENHNFKKNHINIEKSIFNLNLSLSLKNMFTYLKQNIMMTIIVIILVIATIYTAILNYNFVEKDDVLIHLSGLESGEVQLVSDDLENSSLYKEIGSDSRVDYLYEFDNKEVMINKDQVDSTVCKDYSKIKNNIIIEGRYPSHDNEIYISKKVSEKYNKDIGDTIEISLGDKKVDYIIVGMSQHISRLGMGVGLSEEGYKKLSNNFKYNSAFISLKNNVNVEKYVKEIKNQYKDDNVEIVDNVKYLKGFTTSFKSSISIVYYVLLSITIIVISIILSLIIKMRIAKEKHNNGILLGIGYKVKDIIKVVFYSVLPIITFATIVGSVIGMLTCNNMISKILSLCGIYKCSFEVRYADIVFIAILIVLVSVLIIYLSVKKIKKISVVDILTNK